MCIGACFIVTQQRSCALVEMGKGARAVTAMLLNWAEMTGLKGEVRDGWKKRERAVSASH